MGAFALLGRCSGVTMVISTQRQIYLPPLPSATLVCHCPLFRGVRASGMWATATVKQTSDQLIASAKQQVAIIPLTIGLFLGGR